jgi:hypothetical protein
MCDVCFAAAMQPVCILFNPESDHIVFSGSIVGVVNCTFDRMFVDVAVLRSNAQKSTSEHTDLPPIISGDFSTRSTAVCVHVVDKNPFRWRTTPMHRYTQQIFMYSPQQMYWYIEHTVFLKI